MTLCSCRNILAVVPSRHTQPFFPSTTPIAPRTLLNERHHSPPEGIYCSVEFGQHRPHEVFTRCQFPAWLLLAFLITFFFTLANAQQQTASTHEPALDVTSMDRSVDPCTDFFAYSCGGWIKRNPIPPDQSSWDTYSKMQDENLARLRGILEDASAARADRNAVTQKIGDYYASCMDEKAIDAKGAAPLKSALDQIAKIQSKNDLADVAAAMVHHNVLFRFGSIQDYRDANQVIADVDQGGLGLPDRDYYTKDDDKSQELRKQYLAHVQRMFELLGDKPDTAASEAQTVMRIETALAKGSMTRVERRDPKSLDHKMASADLEKLSPGSTGVFISPRSDCLAVLSQRKRSGFLQGSQ